MRYEFSDNNVVNNFFSKKSLPEIGENNFFKEDTKEDDREQLKEVIHFIKIY